ncbi:MAG: GNAT family N-acetyltransferase [Nanoarchaeota archaeon]|nr:GNAT family N-acetyltransferase [Nanoarchaeota archaeon]
MIIRNAQQQEATQIAAVLKDAYNIDSVQEGVEVFKTETNKGYNYLVAVEDNKIVGLTSWQMHGLPKHQLAELDRIAVLKSQQGKGLGKQLFEALIKKASEEYEKHSSKLRKLYLLTHADNIQAQAFYKKLGMQHEATLKEHFYNNKDEFVFSIFP